MCGSVVTATVTSGANRIGRGIPNPDFEPYTGLPRMSNIPVSLTRIAAE
jgi:hypothetical protein